MDAIHSLFGRVIARAFLDNGANVVVSGRCRASLAETVDMYPARAPWPSWAASPSRLRQPTSSRPTPHGFGRIDVVVSNAAGYAIGDLTELDDAAWHTLRATKIDGLSISPKQPSPRLKPAAGP